MTRLCTICARGGSKGVPGKNLRVLRGKPLVAHSVGHALETGLFDAVAVSSDSPAILDAALEAGATYAIRRPDELASDTAGKVPAIVHCVRETETLAGRTFDVLVDLDATAPLRIAADVRGAVELLEAKKASSVITAAPARRSPYFNLVETDAQGRVFLSKPLAQGVLRRQDAPRCFDMNASVYVWRREVFLAAPAVFYPDTYLYEMPEERSHDIDTELDFEWVRYLMERNHARQ